MSNTVIPFKKETAGKADAHGYINTHTYKHIKSSLRPWDNNEMTRQQDNHAFAHKPLCVYKYKVIFPVLLPQTRISVCDQWALGEDSILIQSHKHRL